MSARRGGASQPRHTQRPCGAYRTGCRQGASKWQATASRPVFHSANRIDPSETSRAHGLRASKAYNGQLGSDFNASALDESRVDSTHSGRPAHQRTASASLLQESARNLCDCDTNSLDGVENVATGAARPLTPIERIACATTHHRLQLTRTHNSARMKSLPTRAHVCRRAAPEVHILNTRVTRTHADVSKSIHRRTPTQRSTQPDHGVQVRLADVVRSEGRLEVQHAVAHVRVRTVLRDERRNEEGPRIRFGRIARNAHATEQRARTLK